MAGKKDEDSLNLLIGLILIVFVALALIWAFSGIDACPGDSFSCDKSISSCGCCINDAYGNPIESCDYGVCPEGTYFFEGQGCCPTPNPVSCLKDYKYCKNLIECGDTFCCVPDRCEIQSDGSSKCIPCSVGAICNPEDVKSCCEGLACSADGFCKPIDSCEGMVCENYNSPCQICSTDSTDCLKCEDNSICVFNPDSGSGVCKTSDSCKNNLCSPSLVGKSCVSSNQLACSEKCVNVDGIFTCQPQGNCPPGFYQCNKPGCACCAEDTGLCVSCLGSKCEGKDGETCFYCVEGLCTPCSDSVCYEGTCVSKDSINNIDKECPIGFIFYEDKCIKETENVDEDKCPPGYIYYEEDETCISTSISNCPPAPCIKNNVGKYCNIISGNLISRCDTLCTETSLDTYECIKSSDDTGTDEYEYPSWLKDLKVSCIEMCLDCEPAVCMYNTPEIFDLNKDTWLNILDYEIFMGYFEPLKSTAPIEVNDFNKIYDFNGDGFIDYKDEDCIKNVCSGACRILGLEELGICVTADYYNQSHTEEQRVSRQPSYNLMFKNVVDVPNTFDCSNIPFQRNIPFCNQFKSEMEYSSSGMKLLRNLSYVNLDKDQLGLSYSSCAFGKNTVFGMYLEPTSCSGDVNVYFSRNFLYRSMGYGMAVFNNCLFGSSYTYIYSGTLGTNPSIVNPVFQGNCGEYGTDVKDTCLKIKEVDESKCVECRNLDAADKNKLQSCRTMTPEQALACLSCALSNQCDGVNKEMCNFCFEYSDCYHCDKCTAVGQTVNDICNVWHYPQSVNELLYHFWPYLDTCIVTNGVTPSNCLLYATCMSEFSDHAFCHQLSIDSFWVKKGPNNSYFSKQLYCYYETAYYEFIMGHNYLMFAKDVVSYTSVSNKKVELNPVFAGFMDNCPSGLLCAFNPSYCSPDITIFGGYFGGYTYEGSSDDEPEIDLGFVKILDDPNNYAPDKGKGKAPPGVNDFLNQNPITSSGQGFGTVTNVEGDYSGGGGGFGG